MNADRAALYARFVQLRADLTILGNVLQSDPQLPRLHTAEDAQAWAGKASSYSEQLETLLGDTHAYLVKTAGNRSRM